MSSEVAVKNPLGTERVGKLMVRYAIPSIISIVVNSLYNMVDQIFIGQGVGKCNFAVDLNFDGSGSADWRRYGVLHKPQSGERKKSRGGLWCRKRHFADSWNQRYFTDTL